MVRVFDIPIPRLLLGLVVLAGILPGCGSVPRSRLEESQKITHLLRAENAQLKDRILSLQSQNRDLADRAVDDLRRLTAGEQAIDRLERSVQAYQEDRERLATAYDELTESLGRRPGAMPARSGARLPGEPLPRGEGDPAGTDPPSPKGVTSVDDGERNR